MAEQRRRRRRPARSAAADWGLVAQFAARTGRQPIFQVALLLVLASPDQGPYWLGLPLLRWLLALAALLWPRWAMGLGALALRQLLLRVYQLALLILVGSRVAALLGGEGAEMGWVIPFGLTLLPSSAVEPAPTTPAEGAASTLLATGRVLPDGTHEVRLRGEFVLRHKPVDEFDRRLFLLFPRQIHLVDGTSKRPFPRQEWLAEWFGTLQELISRWESYHEAGDWRRLMSRRGGPMVSLEEQRAILQPWGRNFWLSAEEVARRLKAQGLPVSTRMVESVGQESGFCWIRRGLLHRFQPAASSGVVAREGWLVGRLFELLEQLLARLEAGGAMPLEERLELVAMGEQVSRLGLVERSPSGSGQGGEWPSPPVVGRRELPPLYALQRRLLGWWEEIEDGVSAARAVVAVGWGARAGKGGPSGSTMPGGRWWW